MKMSFTTSQTAKHKIWSICLKRYSHISGVVQWLTSDAQALRNPSIDEATHGRLLRYIIRLSRKSGRLPCQLLLNIANPPRVDAPVGQGGSATIYKGSYKGGTVAIKKTHFYRVAHAHKVSSP
jgi:hypothetical protein